MTASQWSLYMIEYADGRLYTGITTDVDRRVDEHQHDRTKGAKALRGKGPLRVVFQQSMADRSQASKAESMIKKLPKSAKKKLVAAGKFDLRALV
tara:strand:- start:58 stop:342 length:285 start_codon:yes stop_codon:yes gene_type:complete